MFHARQGQVDLGYRYLLKQWGTTSSIVDPIKKSRYRVALLKFEIRWGILPQ